LATQGARVESDEVQLELAVLNLALNARDAMPAGGELLISTKIAPMLGDLELADGDYVELAVKDTGTGMTADVLDRAFEPFFTTKEMGKGTGLGLSQVYGTLHQSGGAVRIESSPDGGTVVRLYLRTTQALPLECEHPKAVAEVPHLRSTILVVDDDPDVRAFLADSLASLGYDHVVAEDGQAALRTVERIIPDAMILDFAMPGINGAEVARLIRGRVPDLPIVFASGYSESAAIESVQDDRSRMLHKPFKVDELQAALRSLLD
jgi:CheY-like chemotaxis protein